MTTRSKKRQLEESNGNSDSDSDYNPINSVSEDDTDTEGDVCSYGYISTQGNKRMKTHPLYKKICDKINDDEPDMSLILETDLLMDDRVKLFQLYELYQSVPLHTEQWLETRNKYIELYKDSIQRYNQHQQYTDREHKLMEKHISDYQVSNCSYDMKYKILNLNTSSENKRIIFNRYQDWCCIEKHDDESSKLLQWLNWAINIPHDNVKVCSYTAKQLTSFLKHVKQRFDDELYGMEYVKEQLLLFLSSKILNPNMKKCSLGLVGPSGVGKTKIARLLAELMDYPFEQISLGGITSPHILKGHPYTYVGAQPGEIVKCLKRMKYKNGILFLDEYEKVSHESTLCAALLHMTDASQNFEYRDNYLSDISIDLSHLWFIYSMNNLPTDTALKDRIFSINVPGYKRIDKINIISDYLLPKALDNINRNSNSIKFLNKKACEYFVDQVEPQSSLPSGVRTLEKTMTDIVNKVDFLVNHGNISKTFTCKDKLKYPVTLTQSLIKSLL